LDPLHDIDLKGGEFEQTTAGELEQAFANFLDSGATDLCVFFHGGLVSRASGLSSARDLITGYTQSGAYPFFFIWNSDLLTVIQELLQRYQDDDAFVDAANLGVKTLMRKIVTSVDRRPRVPMRGKRLSLEVLAKVAEPYDRAWSHAEGLQLALTQKDADEFEEALLRIGGAQRRRKRLFPLARIRGTGNPLARIIQRLNSGHGHGLYTTVIEELLIAIGLADDACKPIWDQMKVDIDRSFADSARAGGTVFLRLLQNAWAKIPNLRLTLIGHSAGAIYVQRFIEALDEVLGSSQQRVEIITLAAAVSFERMAQGLAALRKRVSAIRVFGLSDRREGGYWEVPLIYNKSLLYIVSSLCGGDSEADKPLLGMQRYWSGSRPYDQPYIKAIMEFVESRRTVWAPTPNAAKPGYRSDAKRHGGFPEERKSNESVCYALRRGF